MSQVYTQVSIDTRGVATLMLNRPEVHNAFDDAMIAELLAVLKSLADNDDVRLLVLTSSGK
ncbi:enoyl-CoA hydratase-related protein, partial [Rheinheimera baltica]